MYFIKGLKDGREGTKPSKISNKRTTLYEHFSKDKPFVHWHLFFLFSVSALVNCLEEPLSEPPELLGCCLTLLPQSGVLLSETPNLCLQLTCNIEKLS